MYKIQLIINNKIQTKEYNKIQNAIKSVLVYRDWLLEVEDFASSGMAEFFLLVWFDPVGEATVLLKVELVEE